MNTSDLINDLAKKKDLTKAFSKEIIDHLTKKIMSEVKKGKAVKLTGFGTFKRTTRKARKGRNPQNGEAVNIPAKRIPRFRPGKNFCEIVE